MGNRTRVQAFRMGLNLKKMHNKFVTSYSRCNWYGSGLDYPRYLKQDYLIRKIIDNFINQDEMLKFSLEKVEISRSNGENIIITIFCAKPSRFVKLAGGDEGIDNATAARAVSAVDAAGVAVGVAASVAAGVAPSVAAAEKRPRSDCSKLRDQIKKRLVICGLSKNPNCDIRVTESARPEINAKLIANQIAASLAKRENPTRNIRYILRNVSSSASGIRIELAGRLGGSAIARRETYKTGSLKSSLRNMLDFVVIGVKGSVGVYGIKVLVDLGSGGFRG